MHKQEFLKIFLIETLSDFNEVEKVKVTYTNGKTMKISFDGYDEDDDVDDDVDDYVDDGIDFEVYKDDCDYDGNDDEDDEER